MPIGGTNHHILYEDATLAFKPNCQRSTVRIFALAAHCLIDFDSHPQSRGLSALAANGAAQMDRGQGLPVGLPRPLNIGGNHLTTIGRSGEDREYISPAIFCQRGFRIILYVDFESEVRTGFDGPIAAAKTGKWATKVLEFERAL